MARAQLAPLGAGLACESSATSPQRSKTVNIHKILADGTHLPPDSDRIDHVAVLFPDAGLMIHPVSLGLADGSSLPNWDACDTRCRDLRVLKHDDWQLASREEWERYVLDLTRHDPAVDPNLYPGIKSTWHWTRTAAAWSSSSAWGVHSYSGLVGSRPRGYYGFALAVRRVGQ